jgi:D-alanyl-D-alanine carboxypeptidase (penicillin-binding protein 5/6)
MKIGLLLALCLLSCLQGAAEPLRVTLHARHAILMNADTGAILFEKHARVPAYPASATKIATALYVLDHKQVSLDLQVSVSAEALKAKTSKNRTEAPPHWLESDGSMMGIVRGEILTMNDLMHGLLIASGNDAANAIAEAASGSVPTFVEEMNQYLKRIGCLQTEFRTPHGYHHPEHRTTAYDLCLMTQRALRIPAFREIVAKESYIKPPTNKKDLVELKQTNQLVVKSNRNYYPKAIGVKTGYHSLAGNVLVAAAEHNQRTLIAVVMGAEKRKQACEDARNLFEAAFAEEPVRRVLVPYTQTYQKALPGAQAPLVAILKEDLAVTYYPAEETEMHAFLQWESPRLPIAKGQKVGTIRVVNPQKHVLAECDLYAQEEIRPTFLFSLKEKCVQLKNWVLYQF